MASAVVEAHQLTKVFRTRVKAPGLGASLRGLVAPRYRDVEAVAGIDLHIEAGELVAFIGPNGAGKSTTIKMLTGILYPSDGTARVLGLVPWRDRQKLSFSIATVFGQRSQLWYHLPPGDSLELLAHIYELDRTTYRKRLHHLVERFEIAPLLNTPVRKLSLGERMRCEIVGSLLHRPAILFLDEPTIGLDVVAKQRIRQHIRELNDTDGTTVFLTSHDAGDVEHLCRRVIMINHGTVVFDDSVTALKQQYLARKRIELKLLEPADWTRVIAALDAERAAGDAHSAPPRSLTRRRAGHADADRAGAMPDLRPGGSAGRADADNSGAVPGMRPSRSAGHADADNSGAMPGIDVIRHDDFELILEVDTRAYPIETVISRLMASVRVADVSIEDPPLEEIIASMYTSGVVSA
jgi:ABC-2 type transport system ATP-binding protein